MSNFTNLRNSYMYGKSHRKNNYFQNYKNFENSLDDPIFTGFTISIDTITSPLFFGNYEDNDGLKGRIEENIEAAYKNTLNDSYTITASKVKDKFTNNANIGYGLQEIVFGDELLYGAADYIYMVDNITTGSSDTSSNYDIDSIDLTNAKFEQIEGITEFNPTDDITPENIDNLIQKTQEDLETNIELLNRIDKRIDEVNKSIVDEYNEIISKYNDFQKKVSKKETYQNRLKQLKILLTSAIRENNTFKKDEANNDIGSLISQCQAITSNGLSVFYISNKNKSVEDLAKEYALFDSNNNSLLESNDYVSQESLTTEIGSNKNEFAEKLKLPPTHVPDIGMSLEEAYKQIKNNPSEYEKQQMLVDELKQKLDYYKSITFPETTTNTESTETPNVDVEPVQTAQQNNQYEERTASNNVPQTVKDIVGFTSDMIKITESFPYMFINVDGLDAAYKKYYQVKDPYYGSGDDRITIECLETLDMKMSAMFNKYFNAVYDRQYRRERVPINLRRFNCSIFVHDIRNFREALERENSKFAIDSNGDNTQSKILEVALNYLSVVEFKFFDCEIDPEVTGSIFENISNDNPSSDFIKTKFCFKYGNCVINFLPFGDLYSNYSYTGKTVNKPQIQEVITSDKDILEKTPTSKTDRLGKISMTNTPYDFGEHTDYRRYWDKSALGNVNNDDYKDYIKRDHPTAVDDFIKNQYSNMFANNSVGMIQQASTELDNALHRTILGISASVGAPPTTIADALGVGYLNGSWYNRPDLPKHTEIGNVNDNLGGESTLSPTSTTESLDDLKDSINPQKPSTDLGEINMSGIKKNNTDFIINPNDDNPSSTGVTGDISGDIDMTGNKTGDTSDLGEINVSGDSKGVLDDISGDIDMNGKQTGNTDSLDKLNMSGNQTGDTSNLGNTYPDIDISGQYDNLGQYDMNGNILDNTSKIGQLDVSGDSTGNTDSLGELNMSGNIIDDTLEIGQLVVTGNQTGTTDTLGQYDMTGKELGLTDSLGQYDMTANPNGEYDNLGQYDMTGDSTGNTSDLGKFDLSGKSSSNTESLGKFNLTGKTKENTNNLGQFDMSVKSNGRYEDLGQYDLSSKSSDETKELGQYDLSSKVKEVSQNLGQYEMSQSSNKEYKELGKYNHKESVETTTSIGQYDLSGKQTGETSDLGSTISNNITDSEFDNLGNVFMK